MSTFKKYKEFLNEALVFLDLKKTMKNEFMNDYTLKQDFETAKRLFYDNGSSLLTHITGNEFELRGYQIKDREMCDNVIDQINKSMKRFVFKRKGTFKKSKILNEWVWVLNVNI